MYPISSTAKGYFDNNFKQIIKIRMDTENETYEITENDIITGSFSIDRYSITGSRIEIGTACAGECKFKIKNYNKQWDEVRFEGAQLFVQIGIADWENYQSASDVVWIPCGYFTVDKPVKNASILSVYALDRMAKLDKPVDWNYFTVTYTVSTLVSRICELCDVLLADGASISSMPNADYQVAFDMSADITYRNLLQSACMLLGACAFFNENGQLVIKWYTSTSVSINEGKRYSHTIHENDIEITGVYYLDDTDSDNPVEYLSGTKDYCIDISANPLIGDDIQDVVDELGEVLTGFTYRPYSAVIKPSPYLYPMDMITFVKDNVSYTGIVSNVTFGLNANTNIEGKGETDEDNGYATYGNFTNVQSKIIEYAKTKVDREINERTLLLMNLNEMVMNSLGLYETSIQQPGGGYQYYFHDAPTLANSTIIYTFGANGFAWTDDWNDGDPVWHYGITRDGNAIVNMLSAYKISADIITAGTMRAVNLIFGTDPNTTELRTNDASTGALFEGSGVMQFETKGEFLAKNVDSNEDEANHIHLVNSSTESSAEMYNYFNNVRTNDIDFTGRSDYNRTFIVNNRLGMDKNANNIQLNSDTSQYYLQMMNYKFNSLGSNNATITANNVFMRSNANNNYAALRNYNENGDLGGYISFRSSWETGNVYNAGYLYNLTPVVGANTPQNANYITLSAMASGSHSIAISNNDDSGTQINNIQLLRSSSQNNVNIYNRNASAHTMNFIMMNHYPTMNWNRILLQNEWNDKSSSTDKTANWIQCSNASTSSDFQFFNYHNNGNLANEFFMTTTSNSGNLRLTNRNSSGGVQSALYMNADGTLRLETLVNGSSKCKIQASSYGNLDLVTTGALHFDAGSITVQDGNTYRTGGGSGGSPGTGTDNVSVTNWNGTQNATLHFKNGLYLGYTLTSK